MDERATAFRCFWSFKSPCYLCRSSSHIFLCKTISLQLFIFIFFFIPEGVWDWAGGLSDPEAALLREVLQQDQAEQRGWRGHRPHHGERTDRGMTWRHLPPFFLQTHRDSLLIGSYVTITATKHEIQIIAQRTAQIEHDAATGWLDQLTEYVIDGWFNGEKRMKLLSAVPVSAI